MRCLIRICVVLLILSLALSVRAEQRVESIGAFEDAEGTLTIAEIAALPDQAFLRQKNGLSAGYTRSAHWLRFSVRAPAGESGEWWIVVMPPYIDDVRLYESDERNPQAFVERRSGDMLPFGLREASYRGFVFRVALDDRQSRSLYLRVKNSRTSLAMLSVWKPEQFAGAILLEYVLLGAVVGLMVTLLIINSIFWWAQRDTLVLSYIAYVAAALVSTLLTQGLAAQFMLPDQPLLVVELQKASTLILVAAAGFLYQHMLQVDRTMPWLFWMYRASIVLPLVMLAAIPLGFFTEAMRLVMNFSVVMVFVGLCRSVFLLRKKVPGGMMVVAALMASLVALMAGLAQILGWISGHFLMLHAVMIGLLFTVVSLHMALAVRIRVEQLKHRAVVEQAHENEIKIAQERKAREEQAQFIVMLAHEIRTPVAGIAAAADTIEILPPDKVADVRVRLERIRRGVRRIVGVTDRYLQMDRIDNAILDPKYALHSMQELFRLSLEQIKDPEQRIMTGRVDDVSIVCDADLLATALLNLIDNALKYSPVEAPVELSAIAEADKVIIAVEDHGKGVPESVRMMVFERYVRAPGNSGVPGIGVGLSLVRRIVEIHHGRVGVVDRAGGGARFTMVIPVSL